MTTIKLSGGDFGTEQMLVRCNLSQASAPVEVNYCTERDSEFEGTQFQCADTRHTNAGLIEIGKQLAATALEIPASEFECEAEVIAELDADDHRAFRWAKDEQGFTGDYADWQELSEDERNEYEAGAAGIPTA